ncbi:50S ribosomal protein L24 [Candidatus Saccharibacteria bacterium]|nr:50S ribosomal protein L24 [Candidatus Saccharibacteria bacterium]
MKRIKKDDLVKIIAGGNKGRIAKVLKVDNDKVYLEKVGERVRHVKGNQYSGGQGTKKDIQLPVHISNVALVVDQTKGAEKISKISFAKKDDRKVRIAKLNNKEVK